METTTTDVILEAARAAGGLTTHCSPTMIILSLVAYVGYFLSKKKYKNK